MAMLKLQYQLVKDDYIMAYRSSTKLFWYLIFVSPIVFFCFTNGLEWMVNTSLPVNITLYFILLVFVYIIIFFIFMARPEVYGNRMVENALSSKPCTVEIDESRIRLINGLNENSMEWGLFDKVLETKDQFILLYSTNLSCLHILPKRFFLSDEDIKTFRDLVDEKITNNPETVQKVRLAKNTNLRNLLIIALFFLATLPLMCILSYRSH
jgi:hypothetical protein